MAELTIQERLIEALIKRGAIFLGNTTKCVIYAYPGLGGKIFVGKAGSLRRGRSYTDSIPTDKLKKILLEDRELVIVKSGSPAASKCLPPGAIDDIYR